MIEQNIDKKLFSEVIFMACPKCYGGNGVEFEIVDGTQTMELDFNGNLLLRSTYKCPLCGHTIEHVDPYVPADDYVEEM